MSAKKRIPFIIITILLVLVIFVMLELIAQLIWPYNMSLRNVVRSSSLPGVFFELKPDSSTIFTGQFVKISPTVIQVSSQGIRDYEYPIVKPDGVYRIILLGDSVAFGWGVELEQTFAKLLEEMLNKYSKAKKYEVINFSIPGYNTFQEVATLESKCLAYSPDLVIFSVCDNDYKPAFNYLYPFPLSKYVPDYLYKSRFFSGLIGGLTSKEDKTSSYEIKRGLAELDLAVSKLKEIALKNNIKVLFYQGDGKYIRDVLLKYGFADSMFSMDRKILYQRRYMIEKDEHFNPDGHKKIADDILKFLKINGYI